MSVWILLVGVAYGYAGYSFQIETRDLAECERLQRVVYDRYSADRARVTTLCMEVRR